MGSFIQARRHYNRIMPDTANSATLRWKFTYSLSRAIDCDKDIHDMQDVKFVTNGGRNDQKMITGFNITVGVQERDDAEARADHMALRLVSLLVASSGTYSTHELSGCDEIKASGRVRVTKWRTLEYEIRGHPIVNMDPETFHDLLNSHTDLVERIHHIASARQASKIKDYSSVIKYLVLACNDKPLCGWAKFVYLRHALSHNDGPLRETTRRGLERFGSKYFELTRDGKFDFERASNLRNLKVQACEFLAYMHDCLNKELQEMKERPAGG